MDWAESMKAMEAAPGRVGASKSGVPVGKTAAAVTALTCLTMRDVQGLSRLCKSGLTLSEKDAEGNGALHVAVEACDEELVEVICNHYADEPTYLDEPNERGQTALFIASRIGEPKIVKRLLNARCDPTRRDKTGFTALHVAAVFGHLEVVKMLMARGCDAFTFDDIHQSSANIVERGYDRALDEMRELQTL